MSYAFHLASPAAGTRIRAALATVLGTFAVCTLGVSTPAATAGTADEPATAAPADAKCAKVHLVTTAGTNESSPKDNPNDIIGLANGVNFTKNIADRYEDVSAWQTPYNASVGVLNSVSEPRGEKFYPLVISKAEGVAKVTEHLKVKKAQCPDIKFVLSGFSQGAAVTSDVLEAISAGKGPIQPDDVAGAYVISAPKRSPLRLGLATTNTGTRGVPTQAGAILIPVDQGIPPVGTRGVSGSKPSGAFAKLPGKVRQFCAPEDIVCSSYPDQPAAKVAAAEELRTEFHPDYHVAVSLQSMLNDGSAARALAPHASKILYAITHGEYTDIRNLFNTAARAPGLSKGQRATLRLAGMEMTDAMIASEVTIKETDITGNHDIDRLLALLESAKDPNHGLGKTLKLVGFVEEHTSYMGGGLFKEVTIGGVRVDRWIERDMNTLVRQYGVRR